MFEKELVRLCNKWEFIGGKGADFVTYFRREKAEHIKKCMLLEERVLAGLWLNPYDQNASECMNAVTKNWADQEKADILKFVQDRIFMERLIQLRLRNGDAC